MSEANKTQIGGGHYKKGGEEHWDRAWRLKYDPFQYIITKWVERWRDKGGLQDLKKVQHAIAKYIEVVEAEMALSEEDAGAEPQSQGYVDQDRDAPGQRHCSCQAPIFAGDDPTGDHCTKCGFPTIF